MTKWASAFAICMTLAVFGTGMVDKGDSDGARSGGDWFNYSIRTPLTP